MYRNSKMLSPGRACGVHNTRFVHLMLSSSCMTSQGGDHVHSSHWIKIQLHVFSDKHVLVHVLLRDAYM